jgi:hypothetical protein
MFFALNLPPNTEHCPNSKKKSLNNSINYCLWAQIFITVFPQIHPEPHTEPLACSPHFHIVFSSHRPNLPPPHNLQRLEFVDCLVFSKVYNIAQRSRKGIHFLSKVQFRKKKSTQLCPSHLT